MADDMVSGASDPAAFGLELREFELFFNHRSADALGKVPENLEARSDERLLPLDVVGVEFGLVGLLER